MDAKIKKKWVKALRSGKYKQAVNRLHWPKEGTHCCLGVLAAECDALNKDGSTRSKLGPGGAKYIGALPHKFLQQIGLSAVAQNELIKKNDVYRETFGAIADYIEEYL